MSPTAKRNLNITADDHDPPKQKTVLGEKEIAEALEKLRNEIRREFKTSEQIMVLGIRTRGAVLAERLCGLLSKDYGREVPLGALDITLYRDDLSTLGPQPMVRDSEIPFDITGMDIILVDDVLFTGRTIRAAMDEIIDFGRPNRIRLAVLLDRGGREYPIQGDYVGRTLKVQNGGFVRLHLKEIDGRDEVLIIEGK